MTDSFGARLRQERERQRIDVADVAARTKIKASLFEALERNDVSQWPAGLFRRSFIRSYAEVIGLDPHATVREFLEHFPDPGDPPFERPSPTPAVKAERPVPVPAPPITAPPVELESDFRLTLADADQPFQAGPVLVEVQRRWAAAAWDAGVLFAVGLLVFAIVNRFWMPFGIAALSYYLGGILILGNSPGVCLFAPKPDTDSERRTEPSRVPRGRHTEPGRGRPVALPRNPFRPPRRARSTPDVASSHLPGARL